MRKGLLLWFFVWLAVGPALLRGQSGMFTYQGRLLDGGQPANGSYDLRFALTDAALEEGYLGPTLSNAPVQVSNGLFTVLLDFGSEVFDGSACWLEIGVRTNGSAAPYTLLSPRQPITAAPYALFATTAGTANLGSATNPTIYGSLTLAGPTNVALYATNNYVVTTPPNTNLILVSGAGTAAANGAYTLESTVPALLYANPSGLKLVYLPDDPSWVWQITNSAGALLYGSQADDFTMAGAWGVVSGAAPKPSAVAYGVNFVTNYITQLAIQGANVPGPALGNELYVNAAIGNDIFARRGRPDLPYQTVRAALQAATTNDTVRVAPGIYHETFNMTLRPGLKLMGAGKRVTCLYGSEAGFANLDLSSSNILSGFSTDFVMSLGGYAFTVPAYGAATNVLLENIEAYGGSDVVFGTWWQGFRAVNCDFISRSDCFSDGQAGDDAATNAVAELYNCRLIAGWHGIGNYGRGQIRMFGGSIEARNPDSGACVFAWDSGQAGASIELTGVSLRHATTAAGQPPYAILNQSSGHCTVTVKGMLLNAADVSGAVNYEGFGLTTNIPVLSPGMVTNTLCFTNGILMEVK
jgi:hypothetical protein